MKVDNLIVDSGALLKNAPIWEYSNNLVTIPGIMGEIRDSKSKQWIRALPIELNYQEPSPHALSFVTEFTKKTGDYANLSLIDIKVIALTYDIEVMKTGSSSHLNSKPLLTSTVNFIPNGKKSNPIADLEGFYNPDAKKSASELTEQISNLDLTSVDDVANSAETKSVTEDDQLSQQFSEEDSISGNAEDDSDDEGWITPSNIRKYKDEINNIEDDEGSSKAACITSDFAIQNVLKHIGLQVIGVDGKMIKNARTFILRCYACFKTTTKMEKIFCQYCGHKTLKKVSVTSNPDGTTHIWISSRRPLRKKNVKPEVFRLKGGKHVNNPIVVEDQRIPQQRASKLGKTKTNVFSDVYDSSSPFVMRDIYSRSGQLGIKSSRCQRAEFDHRNNFTNGRSKH